MGPLTMRIYLACLASYNAGKLHGRWVDATQGIEHIRDELAAMLRESPEPNVMVRDRDCSNGHRWAAQVQLSEHTANLSGETTPECPTCGERAVWAGPTYPSAEEYAIHDYEDFGPWSVSEFEALETVAAVAEAAEQEGPAFLAWFAEDPTYRARGDMIEHFREDYGGEWESEEAYAVQLVDDMGLFHVPGNFYGYEKQAVERQMHTLEMYFDYASFAHDLFINDYHSVDAPGGVYVFRRG